MGFVYRHLTEVVTPNQNLTYTEYSKAGEAGDAKTGFNFFPINHPKEEHDDETQNPQPDFYHCYSFADVAHGLRAGELFHIRHGQRS